MHIFSLMLTKRNITYLATVRGNEPEIYTIKKIKKLFIRLLQLIIRASPSIQENNLIGHQSLL